MAAAAIKFLGQSPSQRICLKSMVGHTPNYSIPSRISCQLEEKGTKTLQHGGVSLKLQENNTLIHKRRLSLTNVSNNNNHSSSSLSSPSDTILHFYMCINDKDMKQLDCYISEDCYFEDCSFLHPFNGKKEVIHFFDQLTRSMGQNVKFCIESICEGDGSIAGVNWHLEWKETEVPFTRGCSFYECSEEGSRLVIKKARVLIESPVKPGRIVLVLLKNVTMIFDEFPKAAEWFLKSPHVILHYVLKIYTLFVAPFIKPLIAGYLKFWEFMGRLFAIAIKILVSVTKIFFR